MSVARSALRGGVATLLGQWSRVACQLIGLVVLSRIIAPSEFGKFAMIVALAGLATILSDFGLSLAALRAPNLSQAQSSNLFWLNVLVGLFASSVFFLLAKPIAAFYQDPTLVVYLQALSPLFILNGLAVQHKALLNRGLRFRILAIAEAAGQVGGLALALALALAGAGLGALLSQQLTAASLTLVVAVLATRWRPSWPSRRTSIAGFLRFGLGTASTQVVNYFSSNVDNIVIGRVWGAAVLGVYSRAFQVFALPLQQLAAPITKVAIPILAQAGSEARFQHLVLRAHLLLSYLLLPILAVVAGSADPLIDVMLGAGWEEAPQYLQVLAIGGVFQVMGYLYYWAFITRAKLRELFLCECVGRVVMVASILVAVQFGPLYVAAAYSFGSFAIWFATTKFGAPRVLLSARTVMGTSVRPLCLSASIFVLGTCSVLLTHRIMSSSWLEIGIFAVVCLLVGALSLTFRSYRADYRVLVQSLEALLGRSVHGLMPSWRTRL